MKVDYYPSNEDLITKLSAANGTSGFDIVVPTGPYIPQMLEKGLLQKLDKTLLPNIVNVDPHLPGAGTGTRPTTTRSARTGAPPAGSTTPR
jgi:spermidine/putrescine-binding protein